MTVVRLASRWPGVPRAPGWLPSVIAGTACCWSGCLRQGGDPRPGGGYRVRPGPGPGDLQLPAAPAADQLPGRVQDAVSQCLRLRAGLWGSITRSQRLGRCELEVLPAGIIGA